MEVSDYQAHPTHYLEDDMWWACSEPERPGDHLVVYSEHCSFCIGKFRLDVIADPDLAVMVAAEHLAIYGRIDHIGCPIVDTLTSL